MDPLAEALRDSPVGVPAYDPWATDPIRKLVAALWNSGVDLSKRAIEGADVYAKTGDPSAVIGPAAETAMNMFGVGGPAAMVRGASLGAAGGRAAKAQALGGELPKYSQYAESYPPPAGRAIEIA